VAATGATTGGSFNHGLRVAIRQSGLTLETIQRRLSDRGLAVGRSTLSYWQNGHRSPTGPESIEVVHALEAIPGVADGALYNRINDDAPPVGPEAFDVVATGQRIDNLLAEVGCQDKFAAMAIVSCSDFAEIGPDGSLVSVRTFYTLKALVDSDRYPAIHGGEAGGDPRLIDLEMVSGARLGRIRRDAAANVVVCEMVFDRVIRRGEFHVLHYTATDANTIPTTSAYVFLTAPRSLTTIDVGFHPDCLPVNLEEFERHRDTGPDRFVLPRTLGGDRRVNVVRERPRRGTIGLRWQYA